MGNITRALSILYVAITSMPWILTFEPANASNRVTKLILSFSLSHLGIRGLKLLVNSSLIQAMRILG